MEIIKRNLTDQRIRAILGERELTFSQDQVVGLDEVVEGVLGQGVDIRVGGAGQAEDASKEGEGKTLLLHCVCVYKNVTRR